MGFAKERVFLAGNGVGLLKNVWMYAGKFIGLGGERMGLSKGLM